MRPCDGRIVHAIDIRPRTPYYAGAAGQWRPLARALTAVHAVTRPDVIRSFLAVHVGERCSELRRAESERILRAQPFLAEVRVTAYEDSTGGVRIVVITADEVSLLGGLALRSQSPYVLAARLGEGNFEGEGIRVVGDWANGLGLRDRYTGRITDYSVFGRPYELSVQGVRDELGGGWSATLVHPFFTDLQTIGWIAQAGETRTYVTFRTATTPLPPSLDFSHHFAQIGAVGRVRGGPGHLALFGFSVSDERETPGTQPIVLPPGGGSRPDTIPGLATRYSSLNAIRLNAVAGVRDVRFLRVSGFDALSGEQDIALGTQVGVLAGRSVTAFGATAKDVILGSGLYAATGSPRFLLGLQAEAESRHDLATQDWDDILIGGRAAAYWKPATFNTLVLSEEYSLGLDQHLPFVLSLGDTRGGVRGFHSSDVAGGERTVTRFEDRWLLGNFKSIGEIGVAAFTDVGRIWAEGVPFGVNSPTAVGVGVSLLVAVPIHSKRLWRVDLAFPVTRDPNAHFEIRFSSEQSGRFYIEPRDLAIARALTVPRQIFEYPPQ